MDASSLWVFVAAITVAGGALIWAGFAAVSAFSDPVRRRLKALQQPAPETGGHESVTLEAPGFWKVFEPKKESEGESLRHLALHAGFRSSKALGLVYAAKLLLAILAPVGAAFGLFALAGAKVQLTWLHWVIGLLGAAFIGSLIPNYFLSKRANARKRRLMEALPDALDLLVTCTEAGLGLNAALERVAEQMPASNPELAFELSQVNAEVRAGIDRNTALKNLADRTGLEEIQGLVSLIAHSTRLGTGIAGTLRIFAEDFRDRRMARAEELAATIGAKLTFPLILCLFPSFFIVAVGPAAIAVIRALEGT